MKLDIEQLIADFGGPGALAEELNRLFPEEPVSRAAIYKWRERGSIPLSYLDRLGQLATSQGRSFNIHRYFIRSAAQEAARESTMSERLYLFDTTLRDGEQSPGASMTREEKIRIARQLEKLGVDIIEAGFAAAECANTARCPPLDSYAIRPVHAARLPACGGGSARVEIAERLRSPPLGKSPVGHRNLSRNT